MHKINWFASLEICKDKINLLTSLEIYYNFSMKINDNSWNLSYLTGVLYH